MPRRRISKMDYLFKRAAVLPDVSLVLRHHPLLQAGADAERLVILRQLAGPSEKGFLVRSVLSIAAELSARAK